MADCRVICRWGRVSRGERADEPIDGFKLIDLARCRGRAAWLSRSPSTILHPVWPDTLAKRPVPVVIQLVFGADHRISSPLASTLPIDTLTARTRDRPSWNDRYRTRRNRSGRLTDRGSRVAVRQWNALTLGSVVWSGM